MIDDSSSPRYPNPARASLRHSATVTDLASRRADDVLDTITLVFGGVNYGTIYVAAPYVKDKPIVLYLVPSGSGAASGEGELRGRLDCLITDDPALALEQQAAR
ncbi:MAG: hypothetical protein JWM87_2727 [Candidatus Eremiobacteraeota bacterium]|nr:hypothetical protein [Candidatus Eremiobacteraeota bacterium]